MRIHPQERVWYCPSLAATDTSGTPVDVPVTGWEASFDSGLTWHASRDADGQPGWLIAGTDPPGPGDTTAGISPDHILTVAVQVWVRLRDTPETLIDDTLWIGTA